MKRFYGSAVFEGEEVADSAYTELQDIRTEEERLVAAAKAEFQTQYDMLKAWRVSELSAIDINASNQINDLRVFIALCYRQISQIKTDADSAVATVQEQMFLKFGVKFTSEENSEVASIRSDASHQIAEQNALIIRSNHRIVQIQWDRMRLIASVHAHFASEYNALLAKREQDIALAHSEASDQIAAVIARRYYVPVFMLRCAKGPCEFCRAKYGTTGTHEELEKLFCIPPFHDNCRCWLEEVGYVVMSR